jgi:NAD(P)-dependent dehydrogenase (short-subunit alcohol dehydrogenase family)
MERLIDKVALVTGGGGGIAGATAEALAREGAAVLVVDIDGPQAGRRSGRVPQSCSPLARTRRSSGVGRSPR